MKLCRLFRFNQPVLAACNDRHRNIQLSINMAEPFGAGNEEPGFAAAALEMRRPNRHFSWKIRELAHFRQDKLMRPSQAAEAPISFSVQRSPLLLHPAPVTWLPSIYGTADDV